MLKGTPYTHPPAPLSAASRALCCDLCPTVAVYIYTLSDSYILYPSTASRSSAFGHSIPSRDTDTYDNGPGLWFLTGSSVGPTALTPSRAALKRPLIDLLERRLRPAGGHLVRVRVRVRVFGFGLGLRRGLGLG